MAQTMNEFFSNPILFGEETLNALHINAGPVLDYFMIAVTRLGEQMFFFTVLPVLYWCVSRKTAARIGLAFLAATILNAVVKQVYCNPRPDPDLLTAPIRDLYLTQSLRSPGFPSGHTQGAVGFWGSAMIFSRNKAVIAAGAALLALIPYSRLYLGVHFLGDVIGGYVLGGITLAVMAPLILHCDKGTMRPDEAALPALLAVAPWLVHCCMPVIFLLMMDSILAGLAAGLILADGRVSFSEKNKLPAQFMKAAIGLSGTALIMFAGKKSGYSAAAAYASYWLAGFWITFIAPLIFSRVSFLRGDVGVESPGEE